MTSPLLDERERAASHRIDWAKGICVKCGISHDAAQDYAPCVRWPLGAVMDHLLDRKPPQ